MTMRTAWIAEFAEMKSLLNAQSEEAVKAGLTRTEDRFVPPYGRAPVTIPRHTVFGGTVNPNDILRDPTGNRRYWPISVGGHIDLEKLTEWRDQLWAEAVAAYEAGEKRWIEDSADAEALQDVQSDYMKSDAWQTPVLDWLESRYKNVDEDRIRLAKDPSWNRPLPTGEFAIGLVLGEALNIPIERQDAKLEGRVKAILVKAGYPDVRPYAPKGTSRRTFYVRKDMVEELKKKSSAARKAADRVEATKTEQPAKETAKSDDADFGTVTK
jgi:hypothetical protein